MLSDNVKFYIRSPILAFTLPAFPFGMLWLIAPIDFASPGGIKASIIVFSLLVFFALGLCAGFRRFRSSIVRYDVDRRRLRRVVWILSVLGFSGLIVRLLERVFYRAGGEITADFMANRALMEAGGGNGALALLSGILSTSLLALPFYLLLLRRLGDKSVKYTGLLFLSALYPVSDLVLQGSRSTLIVFFGAILATVTTLYNVRPRFSHTALLIFSAILLTWAAGQVFALRTLQMGLDPVVSMYTSGYAHFAPASDPAVAYLSETGFNGLGGLVFAFVHLCQYILHGFYELLYIAENVDEPTTFGLTSFYIPIKIITTISGGAPIEEILSERVLRTGVYTTIFGPMLYDFGSFSSVIASCLLGFGAGTIARLAGRGFLATIPLYILILGLLPFSFIANLFVSGTGQYALMAASFYAILLSFKPFRIIKKNYTESKLPLNDKT